MGVLRKALAAVACVALAGAGLVGCRGQRSEDPPIHPNWNMDNVARFDPQEPNGLGLFADGRAMRPPVPNTVPNGHEASGADYGSPEWTHLYLGLVEIPCEANEDCPTDSECSAEVCSVGALATTLPEHPELALDEENLRRGQERFDIYCSPCHGLAGGGDGPVAARRGVQRAPSYHTDSLRAQPVGHFFSVMRNGAGKMLSYASQIPVLDRWRIALYVRALQISQGATSELVQGEW